MFTGAALIFTIPTLVIVSLAIIAFLIAVIPGRADFALAAVRANEIHVLNYGRSTGEIRMPRKHTSASGALATVRGKRLAV